MASAVIFHWRFLFWVKFFVKSWSKETQREAVYLDRSNPIALAARTRLPRENPALVK